MPSYVDSVIDTAKLIFNFIDLRGGDQRVKNAVSESAAGRVEPVARFGPGSARCKRMSHNRFDARNLVG